MSDRARAVALEALVRIDRDQAFANLVLGGLLERSDLDRRDRALVTELVYGTTRMRRGCDWLVDRFLVSPPDLVTRNALRLGAYQLAYLGTPPHAAVSITVGVAPKRTRGLVNAVLRKVAAVPAEPPDRATRLSYPDWIVERLVADLGEPDAVGAMEQMNRPARVTEREDGYVQDVASQWVADLVDAGPGQRVADVCAGPGGKATALAATGAVVIACDIRPHRARLVADNASRLGAHVATLVADATAPPLRAVSFDRVLVDAPCSGLGVLRRRPDARWRVGRGDLGPLRDRQCRLVDAAVTLLAPGGTLIYSVCTLTAIESIDVDDHLARHHPELESLPPPGPPWRPHGRGALLLPQAADTDGMTVLRLRRPPD